MLPSRLCLASAATDFPYFSESLLRLRRPSAAAASRTVTAASALRSQRSDSIYSRLSATSQPPPLLTLRTLSSQPVCLGQVPQRRQQAAMTIPTRSSPADDHDRYVDCWPVRLKVRVKANSVHPSPGAPSKLVEQEDPECSVHRRLSSLLQCCFPSLSILSAALSFHGFPLIPTYSRNPPPLRWLQAAGFGSSC